MQISLSSLRLMIGGADHTSTWYRGTLWYEYLYLYLVSTPCRILLGTLARYTFQKQIQRYSCMNFKLQHAIEAGVSPQRNIEAAKEHSKRSKAIPAHDPLRDD